MKNRISAFAIIALFSISALSNGQITSVEKGLKTQDTDSTMGWKHGGISALNLSQTSLTNWVAGGQNSVAINGLLSAFANLKEGKSAWDNSLDLGYGVIRQGKESYRKTDDKVEFNSKYGRVAYKNLYWSFLLNFRTQMAPGYNYSDAGTRTKISNSFAPAYLILALGFDYKPYPCFSLFVAPATLRYTFVTDKFLSDAGAFGVKPGETSRGEFGGYIRAAFAKSDFKGEFMKNIALASKIDLFSNYADKPQNIDVNWETLITMKVNKYISVSFNTDFIYDDNIKVPYDRNGDGIISPGESVGSRTQFKEILGAGFSYKF